MTRLRPHTWSVRAQATTAATLITGLLVTAVAVVMLHTVEAALGREQEDKARARARDLAALATTGTMPRRLTGEGDDGFVQVVSGSGRVLAASPNVLGRTAAFTFRSPRPTTRTVAGVRDDQDLETYRVAALTVRTATGPVTVYVADSTEIVSEAATLLRLMVGLGVPAAVAGAGWLSWIVVGRALRPVERIRAQVDEVTEHRLDARVPVPPGHDQVARLALTMNAMLDRLQAAEMRQRRFTADASHELKTPLARLRTQLEVALRLPRDTADWPELAHGLLADTVELDALVHDLLFLARHDSGSPADTRHALLDLDDVVLEEVRQARIAAPVPIGTSGVSAAPVEGSHGELRRVVRNLLDNAVRHAAGEVRVTLQSADDGVRLCVADDGPGVRAEDRARVFDPFVRLDDARSRGAGGTGLGLAIVAAIVTQHGGTVAVEGCRVGAAFVVQLPAARTSRAPETVAINQPARG